MDWLAFLLRDVLVWSFETFLEPLGEMVTFGFPNVVFTLLCFVGLFVWLKMQAKYNEEAANNPDQIK